MTVLWLLKLHALAILLTQLVEEGPKRGYFPELDNNFIIFKSETVAKANKCL